MPACVLLQLFIPIQERRKMFLKNSEYQSFFLYIGVCVYRHFFFQSVIRFASSATVAQPVEFLWVCGAILHSDISDKTSISLKNSLLKGGSHEQLNGAAVIQGVGDVKQNSCLQHSYHLLQFFFQSIVIGQSSVQHFEFRF